MIWEYWEFWFGIALLVGLLAHRIFVDSNKPRERSPIKPFPEGPFTPEDLYAQQFHDPFNRQTARDFNSLHQQADAFAAQQAEIRDWRLNPFEAQSKRAFDAMHQRQQAAQFDYQIHHKPISVEKPKPLTTEDRIKKARNITPKPKELEMPKKKKPGGGKPRPKPY